jgi:hypothetical protein
MPGILGPQMHCLDWWVHAKEEDAEQNLPSKPFLTVKYSGLGQNGASKFTKL